MAQPGAGRAVLGRPPNAKPGNRKPDGVSAKADGGVRPVVVRKEDELKKLKLRVQQLEVLTRTGALSVPTCGRTGER